MIQCPYCKEYITSNNRICPYCSSEIQTSSIIVLSIVNYFLILVNTLIFYWFCEFATKHLDFLQQLVEKKDGFEDLVSAILGFCVLSIIPSLVAIASGYRKRFFSISLAIFIIFCILDLILLCIVA